MLGDLLQNFIVEVNNELFLKVMQTIFPTFLQIKSYSKLKIYF
jgi:hypothetical protein